MVALFIPGLAVLLAGHVILAVTLFLLQITLIGRFPALAVAFYSSRTTKLTPARVG